MRKLSSRETFTPPVVYLPKNRVPLISPSRVMIWSFEASLSFLQTDIKQKAQYIAETRARTIV
jgi:hypothetical protein